MRSIGVSTLTIAIRVSSRDSEFPPTKRVFCRSDLRIATFTRKISVDTPLVQLPFRITELRYFRVYRLKSVKALTKI